MEIKLSTELSIYWDIDIDNDLDIQEEIGLVPEQVDVLLSSEFSRMEVYNKACEYYCLPHSVDMTEYFSDPHSVSSSHIENKLLEEFGWNIKDFKWIPACEED